MKGGPGGQMVFDFHTHVYPGGIRGFWRRPVEVDELIGAMDAAGVARAVTIGVAPWIPNDVVRDAVRRWPGRLIGVGSVDPLADGAVEAVERTAGDGEIRGVKLHPRLQGLRLEHLPRLVAIAKCCGRLGIPLVICSFVGGPGFLGSRTLELCEELAAACPKTTVVLAHAGGHRLLDALMVLKAHENVFVDLSFTPIYFRDSSVVQDLVCLVRKAGPDRVLYGSDFPEVSMNEGLEVTRALIERLGLSASDRQAILYGNAARLLNVTV